MYYNTKGCLTDITKIENFSDDSNLNCKMVTELSYCNLCEKQKMSCPQHHCTVCYELYCEDCYYETIYENDFCQKCIESAEDTEDTDTEDTDTGTDTDTDTEDTRRSR